MGEREAPAQVPLPAPLPSQGFRLAGPRGRHPFQCGPMERKAFAPVRIGGKVAGKIPVPCRKTFKAAVAPNDPYHKE